jgi:antirestriction protein ArdC
LSPYVDHRWLTIKQANQLGGRVRSGERSSIAVFWKRLHVEGDDDNQNPQRRSFPLLRYYNVFNAEQCDGLKLPILMDDWHAEAKQRIEAAERIVNKMPQPPTIVEGGQAAYYAPPKDLVRIPKIQSFETAEAYYATLFHELAHSTGHESRLNRPRVTQQTKYGSCDYSREELVAELASAFLCAEIGIDNSVVENAASYINGWLRALAGDPKAVIQASGQAQRASDYILGTRRNEADTGREAPEEGVSEP